MHDVRELAARGSVSCEEPCGARHYQGALVAPGGQAANCRIDASRIWYQ